MTLVFWQQQHCHGARQQAALLTGVACEQGPRGAPRAACCAGRCGCRCRTPCPPPPCSARGSLVASVQHAATASRTLLCRGHTRNVAHSYGMHCGMGVHAAVFTGVGQKWQCDVAGGHKRD